MTSFFNKLLKEKEPEIYTTLRRILSANDEMYERFYAKYMEIEYALTKNPLPAPFICEFKSEKPCIFSITSTEKATYIRLQGDEVDIELGNELTMAEAQDICDKIDNVIKERRLFFSPAPDADFINDILSAKKGDILSYNNRNAFVCVQDKPENMIFKYAFHGDIKNIQIDDFQRSETFHIKDKNSHDLQYIYSLAYNYKSSTVMRRKFDFALGNGYYPITEIEENHESESVTECEIGNCKIRLIDRNNNYVWLDADGRRIERDTVALLFAWLRTTSADINLIDNNWNPNPDIDENTIREIEDCIIRHDETNLISKIYDYAQKNNNYASVSFTGLQKEGLIWKPVTFAFDMDENGNRHVYKLTDSNNDITIVEVSQNEFIDFYNERYGTVKNIILDKFKNYTNLDFQKIVNAAKHTTAFGSLSSTEKSELNTIANSYIKDFQTEKTYQPIHDIIENEFNE